MRDGDPVVGVVHWEERLADHGFMRVHRTALVRLEVVREMTQEDGLVMAAGRIAISRRRMDEVRRTLGV